MWGRFQIIPNEFLRLADKTLGNLFSEVAYTREECGNFFHLISKQPWARGEILAAARVLVLPIDGYNI
jgi:hypothetical protein